MKYNYLIEERNVAIGIVYRDELREYDFGQGHPFRGNRYELFYRFLMENVAKSNYRILRSEPATNEDLLLICQEDYIEFTTEYYKAANLGLSYSDKFFRFHSGDNVPLGKPGKLEEAARLIVGQAKLACDLVQSGEFNKVVSIGGGLHHAKPSYGEGFCLYNDVAFSALYLIQKHKLDRVVILDTDAHAGNGTCEYFYENPKVLFIDMHQNPRTLYPGTGFAHEVGDGEGKGLTVNIPMPINASHDSYKIVFESIVTPVINEFKPQIIIRNGGSDPHFEDGLTNLGLSVKDFRMIGEKVRGIASICDGKVIDLITSGYNEKVLPYAWLALISGLAGIKKLKTEESEAAILQQLAADMAFAETEKVVEDVRNHLKDYWACLR